MQTQDVYWLPNRRWIAAGSWQIGGDGAGGLRISHPRRPSRLQRYLMRTLLTITWVDGEHEVTEFPNVT